MSRRVEFRLGDMLPLARSGCGFLTDDEIVRLADATLAPTRRAAFDAHVAGCPDCRELSDDLVMLDALATDGLTSAERKAFDASGAARQPARRDAAARPRPGLHWAAWLAPAAALAAVLALVLVRVPAPLIDAPGSLPFEPPAAVRGAVEAEWVAARDAWRRGDPGAAVAALERILAEQERNADAWYHLGVARLSAGDLGDAIVAFERADALQAAAPSAFTRWGLAVALDRAGRRRDACDALRGVATLDAARAAEAARIVAERCD